MAEKRTYRFIYENSNAYQIRVFFIGVLALAIAAAVILVFRDFVWHTVTTNGIVQSIISLVHFKLTALSPTELFFAGLIGGLFFVFVPLEALFYASVAKGTAPFLSLFMMISGFTLSQAFNYYLGLKFNPLVMNFISKKKVYETRRFVNKYGGYGVFLSNVSPLPAEILTFAMGITRYNVYRLFVFELVGCTLKYGAILIFALVF